MNAGKFEERLYSLRRKQLRQLASALQLSDKGSKEELVDRVMEMHADPCCTRYVVNEAADMEPPKKRKPRPCIEKEPPCIEKEPPCIEKELEAAFEAVTVTDAVTPGIRAPFCSPVKGRPALLRYPYIVDSSPDMIHFQTVLT